MVSLRCTIGQGVNLIKCFRPTADTKTMEPIQGTNASLAVAEIAAKYLEDADNLDAAKTHLFLDAMRQAGAQIVQLIEGLGENVDLYA
jgi:hypothetical protein